MLSYAIELPVDYFDLQPELPGSTLMGPHFVGLGAGKCGTSRWYQLILDHPGACDNRLKRKEINYFSYFGFERLSSPDVEHYRKIFARPRGFVSGEWSPGYLHHPFAIKSLVEAAPEALFIVILRDPITRTLSHISQLERVRINLLGIKESAKPAFRMASVIPVSLNSSLYSSVIKKLFNLVGRDRVLVLQFEQCVREPLKMLAMTYRFLGMDDRFVPEGLMNVVNGNPGSVLPLAQDTRQRLVEWFGRDVLELTGLVDDFDFSLWPDFENGPAALAQSSSHF